MVEDRTAGMAAGPGGGHEHIHCSLKILDGKHVPPQIMRQQQQQQQQGVHREEGGVLGGLGSDMVEEQQPLAVVAAKYFFNGDASVVFRYRLYSFHPCPVR